VSYGQARLTIPEAAPLFDAFRQFGPPGAAIADRYGLADRHVTFLGLGASYDPGTWFLMVEWAKFNTHSILGTKNAGYVSGGYRFGKVTPYATYARIKADSNTSDPGVGIVGLPPQVAGLALQLNAILNQQLNAIPRQATASIGARWDFARNAAIKVQYDRVSLDSGSFGTFGNVQRGLFQPGGRVQIISATFDFVF
jgi:predicted porin